MSIPFACACGRSFAVADNLAGKRTKCPTCGTALAVPGGSAEDEAFRLLSSGPDPTPAPTPIRRDDPSPRPAPLPPTTQTSAAAAAAMKAVQDSESTSPKRRERRRSEYSGFSLSPGMVGGLVSMAVAGLWLAVSLSNNRISIYAPVLFLFGLVAVVRGLLGLSED